MKFKAQTKFKLIFILLICFSFQNKAQQSPQYSMYMFNPLAYNPAYASSKDALSLNLLSRFQWVNLDGAPNTQNLSLIIPIKDKNFGVGFSVLNDKIGSSNYSSFNGDFAYKIKLNKKKDFLSFGLKAGFGMYNANFLDRQVNDETDLLYTTSIQNKIVPNVGFGMYYFGEKHYLGISSPQLIANKLNSISTSNLFSEERQHIYLTGGYVFKLNSIAYFKPSAVVKYTQNAPLSFDINANFLLYEKIWFGAMYRFHESIGINFVYYINDHLKTGYAFDYGITKLQKGTVGSHELVLGFDMKSKNNKLISPRFF
jgi:type IX secretion system PorP/SprF family membrane protein